MTEMPPGPAFIPARWPHEKPRPELEMVPRYAYVWQPATESTMAGWVGEAQKVDEEERFRASVKQSRLTVNAVAEHFRSLGYWVLMPPHSMREQFDDRAGYGDEYDLAVLTAPDARGWRYEVKGRTIGFTGAADYPYETIFVDQAKKADRVMVDGYIMINSQRTHLCLVKASSRNAWIRSRRQDVVKGYALEVYECPLEHARFREISGDQG